MECSWKTLLLLLCASLAVQFTAIRTLRDSLSGPCQGGYRCQSRHHRGTAAHCTASHQECWHQTTKHRDKLHMRCQTKLWHYTVTPAAGGGWCKRIASKLQNSPDEPKTNELCDSFYNYS